MPLEIIGWIGLGACWIALGILGAGKWMHWQIKVNEYPMANTRIQIQYVLYVLLGPVISFTILSQQKKVGVKFPWRGINDFS